jgi:cholesterol 7-dehydrogenase
MMMGETPDNSLFSWGGVKHVWSGAWKPYDEKGKKHKAVLDITHKVNIFDMIRVMEVVVQAVQSGPGIVQLEFKTPLGRGVMFHMVTPLEPLLQKVTHRFYTSRTFVHPWAKMILLGEAIMIARDIAIWNRMTFTKNAIFPKEDAALKRFRHWYSQFYSENSPKHHFSTNETNKDSLDF